MLSRALLVGLAACGGASAVDADAVALDAGAAYRPSPTKVEGWESPALFWEGSGDVSGPPCPAAFPQRNQTSAYVDPSCECPPVVPTDVACATTLTPRAGPDCSGVVLTPKPLPANACSPFDGAGVGSVAVSKTALSGVCPREPIAMKPPRRTVQVACRGDTDPEPQGVFGRVCVTSDLDRPCPDGWSAFRSYGDQSISAKCSCTYALDGSCAGQVVADAATCTKNDVTLPPDACTPYTGFTAVSLLASGTNATCTGTPILEIGRAGIAGTTYCCAR